MHKRLMFAVMVTLLTGVSMAADRESHERIRTVAHDYVMDNADRFPGRISIVAAALDARLALARCTGPLEAYESPNGLQAGRSVVGVRCTGEKPWKIYVPVKIALPRKVVLTRRPLARGETLRREDLWLAERDTTTLHKAYYTDPSRVVGQRTRRALGRDRVLTTGMVQRAKLVKRGSEVQIRAGGSGMRVQMKGKALADGGNGDRIRVKNLASGRVITGTVIEHGVVQVAN